MLGVFIQAFKTPDLRTKLFFSFAIMALYRVGSHIPSPGVHYQNLQACLANNEQNGLFDLVNLFSGGALLSLSIFAMGIIPYITASIIVQLMRVVIPRFEDLHREGQAGQAKMTQYTRYLTICLGLLQSVTIIYMARHGQLIPGCAADKPIIPDMSVYNYIVMMVTLTAGTGLIMWLAELITERGIGNGMSLLIFTGIVANMPSHLMSVAGGGAYWKVVFIIALIVVITLVIVFVEQAQRRIPVQYAKRMVGRRTIGGTNSYIPIKINMSGVIPVIFATSLLAMPQMIARFGNPESKWVSWVQSNFQHDSTIYLICYALMVLGFTFFYTQITFNPDEVADNMKKYGGFIPGKRAGKPTSDYLRFVSNRITTAGSIYLVIVAMVPILALLPLHITQMPFGGTTLLIMVGVGLQTVQQINAQLQQHHYEGFLR